MQQMRYATSASDPLAALDSVHALDSQLIALKYARCNAVHTYKTGRVVKYVNAASVNASNISISVFCANNNFVRVNTPYTTSQTFVNSSTKQKIVVRAVLSNNNSLPAHLLFLYL